MTSPHNVGHQEALLRGLLQLAVPLWVEDIRRWPETMRSARRGVCAQYVAEHGDALQFKQKGVTGEAFNRLAESLALLSFAPGGVRFSGLHFESYDDC